MMSCNYKKYGVLLIFIFLCSCGEREGLAPVVELNWQVVNSNVKQHQVTRGDTLYSIAFRYDQDYRQLAMVNHLSSPYTLRVGQVLHLQATAKPAKVVFYHSKPVQYARPARHVPRQAPISKYSQQSQGWLWPVHGKIVATYAPQQGKKGIDIAGKKGEKIHAASNGVVAYAGNGLSGYGNLIIIKHNNQYLTAYGNNLKNLVREGEHIQAGQAIAEMGVVDRRYWGLHFEIRQAGKPVNPLNYLKNS